MNTRMKKFVGKLSVWSVISMIIMWLLKQILEYLFAILTPWINWLLGWATLVLGIVVFAALGLGILAGFIAFRAWKSRSQEKEKNSQKGEN